MGDKFDKSIEAAERALDRLRSAGATEAQVRRVEGRLSQLRGDAMGAVRREAEGLRGDKAKGTKAPDGKQVLEKFREGAPDRSAQRASEVLTKPGHWAHEAFKQEVFRVIEANGKIPSDYKATLARDAAEMLKVCPSAGGLVAAMVTRGQPRGSFARRLSTKGNDAVGAAYEIMGTAALCKGASNPANTKHDAPKLSINPNKDKLVFGPKAYMNHRYAYDRKTADRDRRTVEADAQVFQNGREVGIDFKHVKEAGTRGNSRDLNKQLSAVAEAISHGQYDEYHFVTNGRFSESFKDAVDEINDDLVKNGNAPIACHEHVTSISDDPYADQET
ncbi:hypothetical protein [Roseovarius sp. 2305UL8-3]|uniref:hypothetical protein n=1 Tax=Roseovarius conchicola TaxID=3121636 RepID=UPI003529A171